MCCGCCFSDCCVVWFVGVDCVLFGGPCTGVWGVGGATWEDDRFNWPGWGVGRDSPPWVCEEREPWVSATSSWEPLHTTIAISISQRKETFCLPFWCRGGTDVSGKREQLWFNSQARGTSSLAYVGSTVKLRETVGLLLWETLRSTFFQNWCDGELSRCLALKGQVQGRLQSAIQHSHQWERRANSERISRGSRGLSADHGAGWCSSSSTEQLVSADYQVPAQVLKKITNWV